MRDIENRFELPKDSHKLAHKFILESLRKNDPLDEEEFEEESLEETSAQTEMEITPEHREASAPQPLPDGKKYFRIGEASEIIGVEPHVLRYWESEFRSIRPMKSRSGHRVYSRKDVELFQQIRELLYVEKFSVKGAKKQLAIRKQKPIEAVLSTPPQSAANQAEVEKKYQMAYQQKVRALIDEIRELIALANG